MTRPFLTFVAISALLTLRCADPGQDPGSPASDRVRDPETGFTATVSGKSVEIVAGRFAMTVRLADASVTFADLGGTSVTELRQLFLRTSDGATASLASLSDPRLGVGTVSMTATFEGGDLPDGELVVRSVTAGNVSLTLTPREPEPYLATATATVTHWGARFSLADGEHIYGLTERIVDSVIDSELFPIEAGTLDRRGEELTMYVRPTISAYAPFYQSSRGFGLLTAGTMPGLYDIGASEAEILAFEFEMSPTTAAGSLNFFFGPRHAAILDEYTAQTGPPFLPPRQMFRHWRGRDELPRNEGAPGDALAEFGGVSMQATVAGVLRKYQELDLPAGVYHFDRPWAIGAEGYGDFVFDSTRLPNAADMLAAMSDEDWHMMVWISNWAIGARGAEASPKGYLVPGSERAIDFTNPDARNWFQTDLREFLEGPEGKYLSGLFLDRSDEGDVMSEAGDIYFDGRNGREMHNAYPAEYVQAVGEVVEQSRDEGWIISRAAYTGTQRWAATWGGDTHSREGFIVPETPNNGDSTDLGLRSVLVSMQRAAFMGLPYWGSDIGGYSDFADREVFARWIQVGALSPLMRFHGQGANAPWDMPTEPKLDQEMIEIYRRYVLLHHALQDYLVGLAGQAHKSGLTLVRPLVFNYPDDLEAQDRWDEWLLGDDLLVAPVWRSGARSRDVYFPTGIWIDFWDREQRITGPVTQDVAAPLDHLPLYIRAGSQLVDLPAPE